MAKSDKKTTEKVLRIGIIQDRQIVNERLIFPGEAVSVGSSSYNSFSLDLPGVDSEHIFFEPQKNGKGYTVHLTTEMDGRVVLKRGQPQTIDELKSNGVAKQKAKGWSFDINESSRGKITIGDFGFLFQFIAAPPISTRPKYDYKPRYVEEDDAVFFAFLGLFSMMAIVFLIYVKNAEKPPEMTQEEITKRFVHLLEAPTPEEDVELPTDDEMGVEDDSKPKEKEEPKEEKKPEEPKEEPKEEPGNTQEEKVEKKAKKTENMSEADEAQAREAVMQSAFFNIGAKSDGSSNNNLTATHTGGSSGVDELAAQLTTGTQVAAGKAGFGFAKQSDKGGRGNSDITVKKGSLKSVKEKKVPVSTAPKAKMKNSIQTGSSGVCSKDIRKVVRRKRGQVKYCYESRIKEDPTIEGRVVVSVSIGMDGKVFALDTLKNTTNDSKLIKCIERKIKKWSFPKDCEDDADFTFILNPSQ